MLTQKRLREKLRYDPETGIFTFAKGKRRGKVAGTAHDARGFLKVLIDNERHLLRRLWMTGMHAPVSVEHINGDRSDNQWVNLRLFFREEADVVLRAWPDHIGPACWPPQAAGSARK